jgi:hypothetical protein
LRTSYSSADTGRCRGVPWTLLVVVLSATWMILVQWMWFWSMGGAGEPCSTTASGEALPKLTV